MSWPEFIIAVLVVTPAVCILIDRNRYLGSASHNLFHDWASARFSFEAEERHLRRQHRAWGF